MTDVFAEMLEDATAPVVPSDDSLKGIAALVAEQISLEDAIASTESYLSSLKRELMEVATRKLPEAFAETGGSSWADAAGNSVTIKPFVSASITEARREDAHSWLRDNEFGDLIKCVLSADVGRDEAMAKKAQMALTRAAVPYSVKEAVHSGTPKAWVREQVGAGTSIPLELFGAYIGQKSTITRGK